MSIPSLNDLLQQTLPHIGWGSVITFCATATVTLLKISHKFESGYDMLVSLTTNHATHMEKDISELNQKTDTQIAIAQSQSIFLGQIVEGQRDLAVQMAQRSKK